MFSRHTVNTERIECYRDEILSGLLQLGREYPWWWYKMGMQISEPALAGEKPSSDAFRWLARPVSSPVGVEAESQQFREQGL